MGTGREMQGMYHLEMDTEPVACTSSISPLDYHCQ